MSHSTSTLDRAAYELAFDEDFSEPALRDDRWVPHYLAHWTTADRSAARYEVGSGVLRFRIDADQPAWRPEDGEMRVSNIQTGSSSGPVGSAIGQHRHRADLLVATEVPTRLLYTPREGLVEAELRASPDPTCMLAFWLVGVEHQSPDQSGELCVAELFGNAIGADSSVVRMGVKAHHDPRLRDDMSDERLDIDASQWHRYAVAWTSEGIDFFVDDRLVRSVDQRIDYELQLMLDLFEFPVAGDRPVARYPKTGEVRAVRGHRRRSAD